MAARPLSMPDGDGLPTPARYYAMAVVILGIAMSAIGERAAPLSDAVADLGRYVAAALAEHTAAAAADSGCELVPVSAASRDHHAWSAQPWTVGAGWPLPGRPMPFHPNSAGMRAAAELVVAAVEVTV